MDRGPDSRGVVDLVLAQRNGAWNGPVTILRGNHEELLLDFLRPDPVHEEGNWLMNGGIDTIESYCAGRPASEFRNRLPAEHLELFRAAALWHQDEHGIYVHAGLMPGVPPEETGADVLLWIREPFLSSRYAWPRVVVFGHTPQYERGPGGGLRWRPLNRPEKIGVDTGAAYGGPLTAVVLPEREFIAVP